MLRISVVGIRGYEAIYSGYETFIRRLVSEFSKNKKDRFFFTVYTRAYYENGRRYDLPNAKIVPLWTKPGKYVETIIYNILMTVHSIFSSTDIILYLGTANTMLICLQKILGRKTIVNTAGIDWNKNRWSTLGKLYLKWCEKMTVAYADIILCDSKTVFAYYKDKYHLKNLVYIPYGGEAQKRMTTSVLKRFGLEPSQYFYTVGRISPENSFEDIILAFRTLHTKYKCVIIGDSIYEDTYKEKLKKYCYDDPRIVFTGFLERAEYEEIASHALCYIESKNIGGTHPSLLEAMHLGKCAVVKDIPEHLEVVEGKALLYEKHNLQSLTKQLEFVIRHPDKASQIATALQKKVLADYNWETVIRQYEKLFLKIKKP